MSSIKRERSSISGILSQLSCVDAPNREKCLALRVQNVPKENALHPASVQPGYSAENSKSTLSYPIWKRLSLVSMGAEHHGMIRTRKLAVPISSLTQLDLVTVVHGLTSNDKGSPGSSQTLSSCSGPTWTFSHLDLLSRLDNFPDVQSFKDLRETEKTFVDHLVFCKIVALELDLPILQAVCQLLDIHIKLEKVQPRIADPNLPEETRSNTG
ncbi:hypothetical protein NEOLI_004061 [Neolecta irregularis DAH-3]|uniref:Uncharacterized protein n=1 Tax=Neolecta irregularis (strain DAH-3) TaxID=1198029 RepID=A0A1U7LSK5_NEOID|nr:hypothetical protein NEOLI_004061 [Neolecta irregularis DAH-3]|eukprot:OLL25609.1 hypothetical protein NEOLI_004061 [Neolecta irregularis DAH-3]